MPLYEFKCPNCEEIVEEVFSMKDAPPCGVECPQVLCPVCATATIRIFSETTGMVLRPQEIYHKNPRRHMEKVQEIMDEPASPEEMKAGMEMLKEREQKLNKPEGTLTTGRKAPKSQKEFDEKVKPVAKRRAQESREMRGAKKWS